MHFAAEDKAGLKDFLYHSEIHDSYIVEASYKLASKTVRIRTRNDISGCKYVFACSDVKIFFSQNTDAWEKSSELEQINALSLEESGLVYTPEGKAISSADALYLIFEAFSGNSLHIVCADINVEVCP